MQKAYAKRDTDFYISALQNMPFSTKQAQENEPKPTKLRETLIM
jgi:hypothetical protein